MRIIFVFFLYSSQNTHFSNEFFLSNVLIGMGLHFIPIEINLNSILKMATFTTYYLYFIESDIHFNLY